MSGNKRGSCVMCVRKEEVVRRGCGRKRSQKRGGQGGEVRNGRLHALVHPDAGCPCDLTRFDWEQPLCVSAASQHSPPAPASPSPAQTANPVRLPPDTRCCWCVQERVERAGGQVLYWNGHRVMGVLAMSRAIGDHSLRPYVIPEPEVCGCQERMRLMCVVAHKERQAGTQSATPPVGTMLLPAHLFGVHMASPVACTNLPFCGTQYPRTTPARMHTKVWG